jgi:hypothetical protein
LPYLMFLLCSASLPSFPCIFRPTGGAGPGKVPTSREGVKMHRTRRSRRFAQPL